MSKDEAILGYKTSMAVFKSLLASGVISEPDLREISTTLARKYGLSSCSIYLENDLLCREKRVIYGNVKGGRYGQKDNEIRDADPAVSADAGRGIRESVERQG